MKLQQMKKWFLLAACLCQVTVHAQNAGSIIDSVWSIHTNIKKQSCSSGQVISNRAMNLFLSDRIGYYLSSYKDLSFYKNNITFNTADGFFSLTHNLFQPKGLDEPVRGFMTVGLKANAANAFAATFSNKAFTNELGITCKKIWISRPVTRTNSGYEKNYMDMSREQQLRAMATAIKERDTAFIHSVTALISNNHIADSNFIQAKQEISTSFYKQLEEEYYGLFAEKQYRELAETQKFKSIKLHWTSLAAYMPVILQRFVVAGSLAAPAAGKRSYPFELSLGHSRFWETKRYGRLLLTLDAAVFLNNSIRSGSITAVSLQEYKNAGGADSAAMEAKKINSIYMGAFANFITTAATFHFVYFPHDSHIGISGSISRRFGNDKSLNAVLGIPVVLIDKTTAPAAAFEFRVQYSDLSHKIYPGRKFADNISVGMTLGIPFSKIIY